MRYILGDCVCLVFWVVCVEWESESLSKEVNCFLGCVCVCVCVCPPD